MSAGVSGRLPDFLLANLPSILFLPAEPNPPEPIMTRKPVDSPCIQFCQLDDVGKVCTGCGRTTDEIGSWVNMSPDERRQIMLELPKRLKTASDHAKAHSGPLGNR